MSEAQLKEIENHLRKIRNTTDLSYSNAKDASNTAAESSGDTPLAAAQAQAQPKRIDPETLMRLIDECKEEEDRL